MTANCETMKNSLLGLLVLAVLAGGFYWVRVAHAPSTTASMSPVTGGESASPASHRVATAASDAMLPDLTSGEATVNDGDVRVTVTVTPNPPVAFKENRFRVSVESADGPVALERPQISFEMVMPMGDHRYALVPTPDGWLEAAVVLPMCASGNPRWYATVEGMVAGEPHTARVRLDLAKP